MSTTKPDTDTEWKREWPDVAGFYWAREHPHNDTPILVEVRRNRLMICGEAIKCDVREAFEASEFLGPISPSDFEQLLQLRKAAEAALLHLQDCGYRTNQQVQEQLIAALEASASEKGEMK